MNINENCKNKVKMIEKKCEDRGQGQQEYPRSQFSKTYVLILSVVDYLVQAMLKSIHNIGKRYYRF